MIQGQINRGSNLGEAIYQLAINPEIKTIVEIGAWNGAGTTKCLRDAVIDGKKTDCVVFSLEAYKSMYDQAVANNQPSLPNFHLIHGRIVEKDEMNWFDYDSLSKDEKGWLKDDIANYDQCPNVIDQLPTRIHLLVLDGGEFSSYVEWHKLIDRSKYIVLDDTYQNTRKFTYVRNSILENPERYEVIKDVTNDRNGYMILRNKKYSE